MQNNTYQSNDEVVLDQHEVLSKWSLYYFFWRYHSAVARTRYCKHADRLNDNNIGWKLYMTTTDHLWLNFLLHGGRNGLSSVL